jgi:hypothetical protein
MENKLYTITVVDLEDGSQITFTTPLDTALFTWGKIFKSILIWLTFNDNQIKNLLKEEEEEYYEGN